ncbi:MAG: hypothetical protein QXT19_00920 [Candidatus Woesearchaeota archaeon]
MKKGQITLFIIIGLILLVSASIVIYLVTEKAVKPVEEEIMVPEDVRPFYDFIEGCVDEVAREGIGILGLQGGFIELPGIIERTPTAYIPIDTFNQFKVPLWYYEGEDRTPSLSFMEREISRHVNKRLKECTGEFEAFKDRFRITEEGNISTMTIIGDNEVIMRVSWPISLASGERTIKIPDFITRTPVRLKQIWELANATMAKENELAMFENLTIDLMAADSENIPLDGFALECGVKKWRIEDIQDRLQKILYYNIPLTRIKNTDFFPFTASKSTYETLRKDYARMTKELEQGREMKEPKTQAPDDAFAYFHQFYDVGARPTDLKIGFEYQPAWGMQLNAQPSEGPVLKSNAAKGASKYLRFLCLNQWHFAYDIIYYVKASIRDDTAFNGQGFIFQFAFPVLINQNAPERIAFGLRRFQAADFGAPEFCTTLGDRLAEIRAIGATMPGAPVLMELPDVRLTYKCFDQECELGTTTAEGGIYRLLTYLPRGCTNPFITAEKEGYLTTTAQMRNDRLDIELKKLQPMKLKFVVHPYHGETKTWGAPRALKENERVSLHVSLVNRTFDQFIGFPTTNETLELVLDDAHYDIDALLFLRNSQMGGYNAQALRIPYDSIAGKETAIIHLVQYLPTPVTDDQKLKMMSYIMEGEYRDALQPEFE